MFVVVPELADLSLEREVLLLERFAVTLEFANRFVQSFTLLAHSIVVFEYVAAFVHCVIVVLVHRLILAVHLFQLLLQPLSSAVQPEGNQYIYTVQ